MKTILAKRKKENDLNKRTKQTFAINGTKRARCKQENAMRLWVSVGSVFVDVGKEKI